MSRIFASKDFLAGGLYMAFGLLGLWLGRNLDAGTASAMEAGYFPRLVCALLVAIGAALAAMSLFRAGEVPERGRWRPLVFVTLSCLAFALLLHPLGLVPTMLVSILLACFAGGHIRPIPFVLICLVLVVATVGIFVLALRIQIPLWPALRHARHPVHYRDGVRHRDDVAEHSVVPVRLRDRNCDRALARDRAAHHHGNDPPGHLPA